MCHGDIEDRITSLAWSPFASDSEEFKLGVVVTGLASGRLAFWSPSDMLHHPQGEPLNLGCLGVQTIYEQQPIRCLAINSYKPNLMVSGGSSVLVHNFDKGFKNAEFFSPAPTSADASPITAVGWNCKVPHIFASASENGSATVWDLKNKKAIMTLSDQNFTLDSFIASETLQYLRVVI